MNYKTIKKISIASSLLTTLAISNFAQAEKANKEDFQFTKIYIKKDIEGITPEPAAIKWKNITISNDKKVACATFAAKNKYNAYDGFATVMYLYSKEFIFTSDNISRHVQSVSSGCHKVLNDLNYSQTPEGRTQIEKDEKTRKENEGLTEKLTEERIANEKKESQLSMERAKKQEEEDAAKYLAESDRRDKESEKKYQENKAKEEVDLQIAIEKSKAEAEEHNRKTNEKVARDEAEQQRVIDKDKVKGLIAKKLFDLLPK